MKLTNQEVVDRLADAIRDVQMVVDPDDTVRIFCEDKQNELPGKKYIFLLICPLSYWKMLFEAESPFRIIGPSNDQP